MAAIVLARLVAAPVNSIVFLFSLACMYMFVRGCIHDAANAAKTKDVAAVRDYTLMAGIGFLTYWIIFIIVATT